MLRSLDWASYRRLLTFITYSVLVWDNISVRDMVVDGKSMVLGYVVQHSRCTRAVRVVRVGVVIDCSVIVLP